MLRQRCQKIESAGRERDIPAARGYEPPTGTVEQTTVEPNDVTGALQTPDGPLRRPSPPQNSLDRLDH
jgi:hypothetical protein